LIQIRKVAVEINAVGIGATMHPVFDTTALQHVSHTAEDILHALEFILDRNVPAVRIHARQQMNAGSLNQVHYIRLTSQIGIAELDHELDENLATDHFIAVHVSDVFEFGLAELMDTGAIGEGNYSQRQALY